MTLLLLLRPRGERELGLILASDITFTGSRLTVNSFEPVSGLSDVTFTGSSLSDVELT